MWPKRAPALQPPVNTHSESVTVLLARLGSRLCALPLGSVVECMRPLPTEPLPGMPPFLLGVSIIRGLPVPVVDLNVLIGLRSEPPCRFILLRLESRRVAVAVTAVIGVCRVENDVMQNLPPLLEEIDAETVTAIGVRDAQFLFTLQLGRVVTTQLAESLARWGEPA